MKTYIVGGAVRDELLNLPIKDLDHVVVGSTPDEMIAQGFKPVGKDFPVFLHPTTHEEYALARTERKTARGYKGFQVHASPDVTLEQDLARRDLTINAIAKDEAGNIVDPFHGVDDLKAGVLRHVSEAFVEDPVRILRVARFSARFDFTIAVETARLMQQMVDNGEVDALVPERVWQELAKGLLEVKPSRMFETLRTCGALKKILPEVDALFGVPQPEQHHPEIDTGIHIMLVVDYAAACHFSLAVRFAALTHDLGKGTTPAEILPHHYDHESRSVELVKALCKRLRVPNECTDLALLTAKFHGDVHKALELRPSTLVKLLTRLDAIRQPKRFEELLKACESDYRGRAGYRTRSYQQSEYLMQALRVIMSVDAAAIAKQYDDAEKIRDAVYQARVSAIKAWTRLSSSGQ